MHDADCPGSASAVTSDARARRGIGLLITPALVLEPAADMTTVRIVMRPVDDAALIVPLVFAEEFDAVPGREAGNARREIDIVRDEQRLTGAERQNEALVSTAVVVVREKSLNLTLAAHLKVATALLIRPLELRVAGARGDRLAEHRQLTKRIERCEPAIVEITSRPGECSCDGKDQNQLAHGPCLCEPTMQELSHGGTSMSAVAHSDRRS